MINQSIKGSSGKNRFVRTVFTAGLTGILMASASFPAIAAQKEASGPAADIMANETGRQPVSGAETSAAYNGDVNTLKAAAEASQLIVVIGNPADPARGSLSYYQKDAEGKLFPVFSVEAVSGMNGISAEKQEGDKKTPSGLYSFTMAFGMKDDPGSVLPYHKVVNGDHFVDDGNSRYYNRLVNEFEVQKDWNSSEVLIRQAPHYNYALVLNYNDTYVPGKGSAIFLHCPKIANNTGTSGCISIPEDYMKQLLQSVDQNTKIVVVQEEKDLAAY